MTQPENKPEPQDGEDWHVFVPIGAGKKVVGRIIDGHRLTFLGAFKEKDIRTIARVLTPDEIAAKDTEIRKLNLVKDSLWKAVHYDHDKIDELKTIVTRQRETIAELVAALDEIVDPIQAMQERADKSGDRINGGMAVYLSNDVEYLRKIARAALTKAKEAGK